MKLRAVLGGVAAAALVACAVIPEARLPGPVPEVGSPANPASFDHDRPAGRTVMAVPGRYIVRLRAGASAAATAARHGVSADHVYRTALNGFAGPASASQARALAGDASVLSVEPDQIVQAFAKPSGKPGGGGSTQPSQTTPTGIDRVDAEGLSNGSVAIAIIDTGIDTKHPDLTVAGGANFTQARSFNDDNGHGTHVAGTAAAKNDTIGVVGMAPGAPLYAVKVLDRNGSGYISWIIAGVDWVTSNAAAKGIRVANMSLGCECSSSALDAAIANSVAAGVTYAVAAGNSAKDAATFSPANHPDVIAVSALADSDGQCGGAGAATSYGADDTLATFSNFGSLVDIAAPGVGIRSTYKGQTYATLSGTSMASPHVAGAAARYLATNPAATPAGVRAGMLAAATPQNSACLAGTGAGGFSGDTDGSAEPLLYAKNL